VEALFFDPNREIICVTLMKFNAKTKSFHVTVQGNFPTAHDFAEPNTYTTTRQQVVGNQSSSEESWESSAESSPQSSNDQRSIYRSPRHQVNDHPPERSIERVVTTEPRAIRRVSRHHETTNDLTSESSPSSCKRSAATILASHEAAAGFTSNELPQRRACALNRRYASVVSETTVDWEGDGRIGEELESLGGSGAHEVMTRLRSLDWR